VTIAVSCSRGSGNKLFQSVHNYFRIFSKRTDCTTPVDLGKYWSYFRSIESGHFPDFLGREGVGEFYFELFVKFLIVF
jgi:hypothetical protein